MKVYYEETNGSFVLAKNIDGVKSILSDLYIVDGNKEWKIREVDINKEGYFVGKEINLNDYSFGDVINEFKNYYDNGSSFYEFKVIKCKYGFRIWKSFNKILRELGLTYCLKDTIEIEPMELFNGDD